MFLKLTTFVGLLALERLLFSRNYYEFNVEFKEFALKGNVMDLAVGIIIGGAFATITDSLVKDIIMPLVAFIFGGGI